MLSTILVLTPILIILLVGGWWAIDTTAKRLRARAAISRTYLRVLIPKKESRDDREKANEKDFREAISIMEPLLASLHALPNEKWTEKLFRLSCFSLEYVVTDGQITFVVSCPQAYASSLEKQLLAQYPDAVVDEVAPPNIFATGNTQEGATLVLKKEATYPLRTYKTLESDAINGITNALSKIQPGEGAIVQFLLRPAPDGWRKKAHEKAKSLYNAEDNKGILAMLIGGTGKSDDKKEPKRLTPMEEKVVKGIEEKAGKVGFETIVRVVTSSPDAHAARVALHEIVAAFMQVADPDSNSFQRKTIDLDRLLPAAIYRTFVGAGKRSILNTEELASLYHLPHTRYNQAPTIKWQNYKIAPAPADMPTSGVLLGTNTYRGVKRDIRITREDRFRHLYIVGQTGTGKSTTLLNLAVQDILTGDGVAVMDPHGDLARDIAGRIPKERADDVIYFNPADTERPMGLNILEVKPGDDYDFIVNQALTIMIKLFGEEIFSPRLQDYFRNGCLALMEDEEGGCLTDLVRLYTDEDWQQSKVRKIKNPGVRDWWENTFANMGQREKQEMIPFWAAKFGQFITNSTMRNIIGQPKSAFDFGDVMNNGKILLINASKGLLGDFNSSLIGMILVTKLTQAAFQRAKIEDKTERKDFFLYIDEFQNFVTDSIESILSEARKYRLSLNVCHQYIGQLVTDKNEKIKNAIFGNVGSMMAYKIGAPDAEFLQKEFQPVFSDQDLINIDVRKAVVKLSINGQPSRPFSLTAADPISTYPEDKRLAQAIIQLSRLRHSRDRKFVDREILLRIGSKSIMAAAKALPPPAHRQTSPSSGQYT